MEKRGGAPASFGRRVWVSCLCAAYFWSNGVAAYAAESNFWADRRRASADARGGSYSDERSPGSPASGGLLAGLPAAEPASFGSMRATAGAGLSLDGGLPAQGSHASVPGLPAALSAALLPYGSIREVRLSPSRNAPFIIHIQDAHEIEAAQRNMAAMVSGLRAAGVRLVGLEGASGPFAVEAYRAYPDRDVTRGLADYFLKGGYIGGPEFAALTAPEPPLLWGVEDAAGYRANVQALLDGRKRRAAMDRFLSDASAALMRIKENVYSPALRELDRRAAAYQSRAEGLAEHAAYLMGQNPPPGPAYANLTLFLQSLSLEKAIDFQQVEKDRQALIDALSRALPRGDLETLVRRGRDYRRGLVTYGGYYGGLKRLAESNGVPLSRFGRMDDYVRYVLLAERIDREKLLDELAARERGVLESLAATPDQKRAALISRRLALLSKLAAHAMTPREWREYRGERAGVLSLPADLGIREDAFEADIAPFEDFCRSALSRNTGMVENLISKMRAEKAGAAVLVAGGFHTDGLTGLLRGKNVSYVVVAPRIDTISKERDYLDVFGRDGRPLEKLFSGEPITLKYTPPLWAGADTRESRFMSALFHAAQEAFNRALGGKLSEDDLAALGERLPHKVALKDAVKDRGGFTVHEFEAQVDGRPFTCRAVVTTREKLAFLKAKMGGREPDAVEVDVAGTPYVMAVFRTHPLAETLRAEIAGWLKMSSLWPAAREEIPGKEATVDSLTLPGTYASAKALGWSPGAARLGLAFWWEVFDAQAPWGFFPRHDLRPWTGTKNVALNLWLLGGVWLIWLAGLAPLGAGIAWGHGGVLAHAGAGWTALAFGLGWWGRRVQLRRAREEARLSREREEGGTRLREEKKRVALRNALNCVKDIDEALIRMGDLSGARAWVVAEDGRVHEWPFQSWIRHSFQSLTAMSLRLQGGREPRPELKARFLREMELLVFLWDGVSKSLRTPPRMPGGTQENPISHGAATAFFMYEIFGKDPGIEERRKLSREVADELIRLETVFKAAMEDLSPASVETHHPTGMAFLFERWGRYTPGEKRVLLMGALANLPGMALHFLFNAVSELLGLPSATMGAAKGDFSRTDGGLIVPASAARADPGKVVIPPRKPAPPVLLYTENDLKAMGVDPAGLRQDKDAAPDSWERREVPRGVLDDIYRRLNSEEGRLYRAVETPTPWFSRYIESALSLREGDVSFGDPKPRLVRRDEEASPRERAWRVFFNRPSPSPRPAAGLPEDREAGRRAAAGLRERLVYLLHPDILRAFPGPFRAMLFQGLERVLWEERRLTDGAMRMDDLLSLMEASVEVVAGDGKAATAYMRLWEGLPLTPPDRDPGFAAAAEERARLVWRIYGRLSAEVVNRKDALRRAVDAAAEANRDRSGELLAALRREGADEKDVDRILARARSATRVDLGPLRGVIGDERLRVFVRDSLPGYERDGKSVPFGFEWELELPGDALEAVEESLGRIPEGRDWSAQPEGGIVEMKSRHTPPFENTAGAWARIFRAHLQRRRSEGELGSLHIHDGRRGGPFPLGALQARALIRAVLALEAVFLRWTRSLPTNAVSLIPVEALFTNVFDGEHRSMVNLSRRFPTVEFKWFTVPETFAEMQQQAELTFAMMRMAHGRADELSVDKMGFPLPIGEDLSFHPGRVSRAADLLFGGDDEPYGEAIFWDRLFGRALSPENRSLRGRMNAARRADMEREYRLSFPAGAWRAYQWWRDGDPRLHEWMSGVRRRMFSGKDRGESFGLLQFFGAPLSVEESLSLLMDDWIGEKLKTAVIASFESNGSPEAVDALGKVLVESGSRGIKKSALRALGAMKTPAAIEMLGSFLSSQGETEGLQWEAAKTLEGMGTPGAAVLERIALGKGPLGLKLHIVEALRDADSLGRILAGGDSLTLRSSAFKKLCSLPVEEGFPWFEAALKQEEDDGLVIKILLALDEMGRNDAVDGYLSGPGGAGLRRYLASALDRFPSGGVSFVAVETLLNLSSRTDDPEMLAHVERLLRVQDAPRGRVLAALGRMEAVEYDAGAGGPDEGKGADACVLLGEHLLREFSLENLVLPEGASLDLMYESDERPAWIRVTGSAGVRRIHLRPVRRYVRRFAAGTPHISVARVAPDAESVALEVFDDQRRSLVTGPTLRIRRVPRDPDVLRGEPWMRWLSVHKDTLLSQDPAVRRLAAYAFALSLYQRDWRRELEDRLPEGVALSPIFREIPDVVQPAPEARERIIQRFRFLLEESLVWRNDMPPAFFLARALNRGRPASVLLRDNREAVSFGPLGPLYAALDDALHFTSLAHSFEVLSNDGKEGFADADALVCLSPALEKRWRTSADPAERQAARDVLARTFYALHLADALALYFYGVRTDYLRRSLSAIGLDHALGLLSSMDGDAWSPYDHPALLEAGVARLLDTDLIRGYCLGGDRRPVRLFHPGGDALPEGEQPDFAFRGLQPRTGPRVLARLEDEAPGFPEGLGDPDAQRAAFRRTIEEAKRMLSEPSGEARAVGLPLALGLAAFWIHQGGVMTVFWGTLAALSILAAPMMILGMVWSGKSPLLETLKKTLGLRGPREAAALTADVLGVRREALPEALERRSPEEIIAALSAALKADPALWREAQRLVREQRWGDETDAWVRPVPSIAEARAAGAGLYAARLLTEAFTRTPAPRFQMPRRTFLKAVGMAGRVLSEGGLSLSPGAVMIDDPLELTLKGLQSPQVKEAARRLALEFDLSLVPFPLWGDAMIRTGNDGFQRFFYRWTRMLAEESLFQMKSAGMWSAFLQRYTLGGLVPLDADFEETVIDQFSELAHFFVKDVDVEGLGAEAADRLGRWTILGSDSLISKGGSWPRHQFLSRLYASLWGEEDNLFLRILRDHPDRAREALAHVIADDLEDSVFPNLPPNELSKAFISFVERGRSPHEVVERFRYFMSLRQEDQWKPGWQREFLSRPVPPDLQNLPPIPWDEARRTLSFWSPSVEEGPRLRNYDELMLKERHAAIEALRIAYTARLKRKGETSLFKGMSGDDWNEINRLVERNVSKTGDERTLGALLAMKWMKEREKFLDPDFLEALTVRLPVLLEHSLGTEAGQEALQRILAAFHQEEKRAFSLDDAGERFDREAAAPGKAVAVEVTWDVLNGAAKDGSEETARRVLGRVAKALAAEEGATVVLAIYGAPEASLAGRNVLNELIGLARLDGNQAASVLEHRGRLVVEPVNTENGLLGADGRIVTEKLKRSVGAGDLTAFALNPAHWDIKDVLTMLAGDWLSDPEKTVASELHKILRIGLQA